MSKNRPERQADPFPLLAEASVANPEAFNFWLLLNSM